MKMLISLFCTLCFCTALTFGDLPNQKPRARGFENRTAVLYKNEVKGSDAKGRDYDLIRKQGEADLKLSGGSRSYDTSAGNGRASAKEAGGKTAIATKIGSGGTYETPKNKGDYRTSQQGSDKIVNLNSNGNVKLDVKDINKEKDFTAVGNKHTWETDPNDANYKNGVLKTDQKPYNYAVDKTSDGKATAQLSDPSQKNFLMPNGKTYKCTTQTDSITNCINEKGIKVGEVRGSKAGNVAVSNSWGVPIGTANVEKDASGKKTAVANGIFRADSAKQVDSNCPGFTNDKVKLSKAIKFTMQSQKTPDGGTQWVWPACFDASIDVTLGPGVRGKDMAFRWLPLILPAGNLRCQDPATIACGATDGECYYCDMCDPVKRAKVTLLGNSASNLCEATGGQSFTTSATICPPPFDSNMANYCDHFSKGLGDPYWQKQGNLDVTFEVYNRKTDQDFANVRKDPKLYSALVAEYRKTNPLVLIVPDDKLKDWYKRNKSDKIGCRRSIINYNLSGGASAGWLLDAAAVGSALQKNPCPPPKK